MADQSANAPTEVAKLAGPLTGGGELGNTGLKASWGYVQEEYLPELTGAAGLRAYRMMADDDATVGAILYAIEMLLRSMDWEIEAADESAGAQDGAEFLKSLMEDMSQPWEDFLAEALTCLQYGWSYFEIVTKRRMGPEEKDGARRSNYTDGKIGIRKLSPRPQDSLLRWQMQEDGGIEGMWQAPPLYAFNGPSGGNPDASAQVSEVFIPIAKALLFRANVRKNNPEGQSILRRAYRAWYKLRGIQDSEAVGIERELAGLPVVSIPTELLNSTKPDDVRARNEYQKLARDLKFNAQGGVVIPSDTYATDTGNPGSVKKVTVELLSSAGSRTIDTVKVKEGYQRDIARAVLADFIMLGTDSKGSYALSDDKSSMFLRTIKTFAMGIAAVCNRYLWPKIWRLNGMDLATMPKMKPGNLGKIDLAALATFIKEMAAAGNPMFPDDLLDEALREMGGLPARNGTQAMDAAEEAADREAERAAALAEATAAARGNAAPGGKPAPVANKPPPAAAKPPMAKGRKRTVRASS